MSADRRKPFTQAEGDLGVPEAFRRSFDYGSREVVPVEARSTAVALPFSARMFRAGDNLYDYIDGEAIGIISEEAIEEVSEDAFYSNILDDIFKNKPELAAEYFSRNPKQLFELIDGSPGLLSALSEIVVERQAGQSTSQ